MSDAFAIDPIIRLAATGDDPAWAPDGRRIVLVASATGVGDSVIVTIAPDGSDLRPVSTGADVQGLRPRLRPTP